MTALNRLEALLKQSLNFESLPAPSTDKLDAILVQLKNQPVPLSKAAQETALRDFWHTQRIETPRHAFLVSFSMCIPISPSGPCIMEDRQRFRSLLDTNQGLGQWAGEPRRFRRCYRGLVRSYFTYDVKIERASSAAKQNWCDLRDYLYARVDSISGPQINLDWVDAAICNRHLFGENPCAPYADDLLRGDTSKIDMLSEQLGIEKKSWFFRETILAQVRQATAFSQDRFRDFIPQLLEMLRGNEIIRDSGLILILDKYATASQPRLNEHLRNASVEWWGNPWLPSNDARWGGVTTAARTMVSEWLKREFVEAFFTKLAQDGVGDRRRAEFWLRYVKSMDHIQFALGPRALNSPDRDFVVLRKKMDGLYTDLKDPRSDNNAFIMTMGNLVIVEFGDAGAVYGYNAQEKLPFNANESLRTGVNTQNSLKQSSRIFWQSHHDRRQKWEDTFEEELIKLFGIYPATPFRKGAQHNVRPNDDGLHHSSVPREPHASSSQLLDAFKNDFSETELAKFVQAQKLVIQDNRSQNGNLWVLTQDKNSLVNKVLQVWGFSYKSEKGWWRE